MKRQSKLKLLSSILICALIIPVACVCKPALAANPLAVEIKKQLQSAPGLYYPKSVLRFYSRSDFQPSWIKQQGGMGPAWQAMLMIDCVLQFGLSHDDYHPKELTYPRLHSILDTPEKVKIAEQARYEILLTDAVLTLMNHLHYGKLNPEFSATRIDSGQSGKFNADVYLASAMKQKDILGAIANAQPQNELYAALQRRMHLLKGQYDGDCYEVPVAEVRKIAINMERLRWAAIDEDSYILINIPEYTMIYKLPDTTYRYKVAVGKPQTPTPTLSGKVDYFVTAPDARVVESVFQKEILPSTLKDINYLKNSHYAIYDRNGQFIKPNATNMEIIARNPEKYYARHSSGLDMTHGRLVFNLANPYHIYLHDIPKKDFFEKNNRALSNGCVWLSDAGKLGEQLLAHDGNAKNITGFKKAFIKYQRKTYILKKSVPIHIIYITCAAGDWGLITYEDVYHLDQNLEKALYNTKPALVMNEK
ncbi:MAG: L,D-transpeptidase family protein [Mucilaginibacter sp.]|uniref:L,D-transpeptidase family protein n=1 Tax=Mucilaginibacter sp. TaxID=1882438 RepID=UPI0031B20B6E